MPHNITNIINKNYKKQQQRSYEHECVIRKNMIPHHIINIPTYNMDAKCLRKF